MKIKEFNDKFNTLTSNEINDFISEHQDEDLPTSVLGKIFESLFIDRCTGTSPDIDLPELIKIHHSFSLGNGGGWSRNDKASYLGRKYIMVNHKQQGRIVSVEAVGFKSEEDIKPKYKKVSTVLLEKLEDATDAYCVMQAALETGNNIPDLEDAIRARDNYEQEMLNTIRKITN